MSQRNRTWADTIFLGTTIGSDDQISSNLLTNAPTVDTITAIRIIGDLEIGVAITSEIEFQASISVGIGVSSVEAFAVASEAGLPRPFDATDFPPRGWLYRSVKDSWQFKAAADNQQKSNAMFHFDVRASRRVDKGVLFLIIRNSADSGAVAVSVTGIVRVLCLT